jgi:putative spermidine/putrescine transport system substrate-binding protein
MPALDYLNRHCEASMRKSSTLRQAFCAGGLGSAILALLLSGPAVAAGKSCHPDGKPVDGEVVFHSSGGTYGDAIQKVFFEPFEAECGIHVRATTGPRTYAQLRQYVRTGNLPWDMGATVTDQEYALGQKDDLFHKLPAGFWDAIKGEMIANSYSDYGAWATPYSDLLIYAPKIAPQGMTGWADFWDVAKFPGPRMMQNSPMSLIPALLADGVAPDKLYPLDLDRAFRKMDQLRPNIRAFWSSADPAVQGVVNGEFAAATTWSGRFVTAAKQGKPIAAVWNGAVMHVSWTFILKGTQHARADEALLYFMQRADRQAELAKQLGYTGASSTVDKLLDPAIVATLPASAEHLKVAALVDADWWATHNAEVQARWDAWVAQH